MKDSRDDGGQVLPLAVLVLMAAMLGVLGLAQLAGEVTTQARASAAADAAALAGATDGREAAEALAVANGGRLVRFEQLGVTDVRVEVEVDGRVGRARARRFTPSTQG